MKLKSLTLFIIAVASFVIAALPIDSYPQAKVQGRSASQPAAGELISWQVVGIGGTSAASVNYALQGTLGQTAPGRISSTNYRIEQGFWQLWPGGCCVGTTGNVNMLDIVDISDLSALIGYLTGTGYVLPCEGEANVNARDIVDISDLSALIAYLTGAGYVLPSCP